MRHTFLWVRVHLVWSTYRRQPWIGRAWQERLYKCLAAIAKRRGAIALAVGGWSDHVHIYVSIPADLTISNLVNALKCNSCSWIRETFPRLQLFAWQKGYSAFSVCRRCEDRVIAYINNQEARHSRDRYMAPPVRAG